MGRTDIELLSTERRDGDRAATVVEELADLLVDCVEGGASLGFLTGLRRAEAAQWWQRALAAPGSLTLVARDDGGAVVGAVRLLTDTPANAPHRAEVAKLLVHRDARGRGRASALMQALEDAAAGLGRTLLTLDTETGSLAERCYTSWGWERVGVIDDYALTPDGRLAATTLMVKRLPPRP